jgi:L-fuculose-phosphate aldolase
VNQRSDTEERPDALLEELGIACRQLAFEGHEDGNWAHLSMRDPNGRGFWLKRSGCGLSEIEGPDDFVLLDLDGNQLAGSGNRHLEWPIHAGILRARAEVNAVAHTHAQEFRLFSATDVPLQQLTAEATPFVSGLPRFRATSDLIRTPELGALLADSLGGSRAVLMASHGAAVVGRSVAELAVMVLSLTKAIAAQAAMAATGWPVIEADRRDAAAKAERAFGLDMMDAHWSYYLRRDRRQSADRRKEKE